MKENDFEKDIKIIESIVEEYESCSVPEIDMQVDVTFGKEQNSALKHILSDYKRVLEINEVLLKENEELRKKLNEENKRCMMLAIEKQDYFEKYRYHLQQNERLTKEFSNVILVQKVKDKIEDLIKPNIQISNDYSVKDLENIFGEMKGFTKDENDYFWNKIEEKSTIIEGIELI